MENLTFVCLHCQKAYRLRAGLWRVACPFCAAGLYRVAYVPPKSKPKQWEALRKQLFCMETSLEREITARSNELLAREYKLERQHGRKSRKLAHKAEQHRKKLNNSLKEA